MKKVSFRVGETLLFRTEGLRRFSVEMRGALQACFSNLAWAKKVAFYPHESSLFFAEAENGGAGLLPKVAFSWCF